MKYATLILAVLFCGCGARHYQPHPLGPPQTCSTGGWSQTEHCSCPDGYEYNRFGKRCDYVKGVVGE